MTIAFIILVIMCIWVSIDMSKDEAELNEIRRKSDDARFEHLARVERSRYLSDIDSRVRAIVNECRDVNPPLYRWPDYEDSGLGEYGAPRYDAPCDRYAHS